jgi:ABC-type cobalamin/Fe3+-siderophores transport system ATPase subunit
VLRKVLIKNYRVFNEFVLDLSPGVNIIVGDNDAGKSTLLEAINLALTGRLRGNPMGYELSPYLFSQDTTRQYVQDLRNGRKPVPPDILIEVYLDDIDDHAVFKGTNNSSHEDCPGVRVRITLDEDFSEEYRGYVQDADQVNLVPTEYYKVEWLGFSGNPVKNTKSMPDASLIDASAIKLQNGADYYLQQIINGHLNPVQRVELSRSYRSLREAFANIEAIEGINTQLAGSHGDVSRRRLSLSIDISQRASWERSLVPHLDDLPFQFLGNGEQSSLKIMLALHKDVDDHHIVLVEEPENHLSFSSLNILMEKITARCDGKQVLVTTHSSYVLNKLGLENLVLLTPQRGVRIADLPADTVDYFKKLPGYDTLRLVLAKRVILVEGPSDELVVQRAYRDVYGRLPIEDGVDVISVRGLQAKRFLDIAVPLAKPVAVVNDNDGDADTMRARYADYTRHSFLRLCIGEGDQKTLEPQMLAANGLDVMNKLLGRSYGTEAELLAYMQGSGNKTTCALAIFESADSVAMPEYIRDAITQ